MPGFPDSIWEFLWFAIGGLVLLSPIWVPAVLFFVFYNIWMDYIIKKRLLGEEYVVLEVKLPKEILRSPAAMESVLTAFWQSDPGNTWIKKYIEGKVMDWFSLELASFGGEVHFFIWGNRKYKNVIESRIYAQYPNVEIYEVPDYAKFVTFDPDHIKVWGTEYKLKKPDPYPLMTYVDYGLDKDPKEEFKIDPLVPLIEYLGSIQKEEIVWHQIIIRKHVKRRGRKFLFKKNDWTDEAKDLVKKIKEGIAAGTGQKFEQVGGNITEQQKKTISAIERSITKSAFEVGIRSIYMAPHDVFQSTPNISGLFGSFYHVNSQDLNAFEAKDKYITDFSYPWQDYKDIRMNQRRKTLIEAYKSRSMFYPPHKRKYFILNSEELATIYHFPGGVSQTPTFGRIGSKKADPPTNLPV